MRHVNIGLYIFALLLRFSLSADFFHWHSVSNDGGALFPAVAIMPAQTLIKADYVSHPVTI